MSGNGEKQLKEAMNYILSEKAANDFIQFSSEDKIDIIPFNDSVKDTWSTNNGTNTADVLRRLSNLEKIIYGKNN